jgi:hypothetical protein
VEAFDNNKVIERKTVKMDKKFRIPIKKICEGKEIKN